MSAGVTYAAGGADGRQFYVAMIVLLFAEILGSMESTMMLSAMPAIVRQFGDVQTAGWLMTSFGLITAATAAIGGRLGDIFGRRRLLLVVVALSCLGSLISAVSGSLGLMIVGRAIQGTSGIILPLCYGMTRDLAPDGKAPFWIALLTGGYAFSSAIGYVLGGMLADDGQWASIFTFTAAVSAISFLMILAWVPTIKGAGSSGKLDMLGAVLFAPAIASILYGLTQVSKWGWASPGVWAYLLAGSAVLGYWFRYEVRHPDPLIDVRLLGQPPIMVANLSAALAGMGSMQIAFVLFMLLQQPVVAGIGLGISATMAGVLKLPSNISALVGAPIGGWIATRHGARWTVLTGGLIGTIAWGTLAFTHYSVIAVVVLSVVCALGNIMLLVGIPNMVLELAPRDRSSEATGVTTVTRGLFSAVGSQLMAILLGTSVLRHPGTGAMLPSDFAYQLTFGVIAGTSFLVVCIVLVTLGRTGRTVL